MMNISTNFVFIHHRGGGKSFLIAIYVTFRAILYPGSKIIVASATRGQAQIILDKILLELKPQSAELANEIFEKQTKINGTNAQIVFKNSSYIRVVTAGDSARGARAHVLILDEFRLLNLDVVNTILRKFLIATRMPRYSKLTDQERKREYRKERNKMMYLSSAYTTDSWAYTKCTDTCNFMLDDSRSDFICGFPFYMGIQEGILRKDDVLDEMAEESFSEIKWSMEMGSLWWGAQDGAFFDYETISKNRKIKYPMYPHDYVRNLPVKSQRAMAVKPKQPGEIRILSGDIALMSSKKHNNDASAIFINAMQPTKAGIFMNNIIYGDVAEGLRTEDQALMIRKLYDEFECDYIVLDTNGIGLGVFDCLASNMVDAETGEIYPALSCMNDAAMAERCVVPGADKVIWSIKASAQFNSDCAFLLREGFKSGRIRLLLNEYDAEGALAEIPGYKELSQQGKLRLQMPYIHTTLLIDELVKLRHEENNGKVKVFERAGARKDRYSSLSYNYYVSTMIARKSAKRQTAETDKIEFVYRAPKVSQFKENRKGRW